MRLLSAVSVSITVTAALWYMLAWAGIAQTLAITFGTISYHLLVRLLIGFIFDKTMQNHADYTKAWFQPRSWEKKLYRTLGVKRWKAKMPTFNPQEFSVEHHSLDELAQAMCQAELVHEVCALASFLPVVAACWFGALPVFLLTSIGGAVLDLLFVMIQRYNRPRILRLMRTRG